MVGNWLHDDIKISGKHTVQDWRMFKKEMIDKGTEELWKEAYQKFFRERIKTRYLDPLDKIEKDKTWSGEGTSIMTIICSLIEFLQASYDGLSYHSGSRDTLDHQLHYGHDKAKWMFKKFLKTQPPFNQDFGGNNSSLPNDFYENVRCGLIHEARLKGKWTIHAHLNKEGLVYKLPSDRWAVNRTNFKKAIFDYINHYEILVINDKDRQRAFIRKIDSLCQE
jgi:hypothetical protein